MRRSSARGVLAMGLLMFVGAPMRAQASGSLCDPNPETYTIGTNGPPNGAIVVRVTLTPFIPYAGQLQTITVAAGVSPPDPGNHPITEVTFTYILSGVRGSTHSLAESSPGVWEGSWTATDLCSAPEIQLEVAATNDVSTSAPVITFPRPYGTTTSLASSPNPSFLGQAVTFTATVSNLGLDGVIPTGMVYFYDGVAGALGPFNGSMLDASGQATVATADLSVGSHSIQALYVGGSLPGSFSNSLVQVVNAALRFGVVNSGGISTAVTPAQTLALTLPAGTAWTATSDQPFVVVSPASGTGAASLTVSLETASTGSLSPGQSQATVTVTSGTNSNTIEVNLDVHAPTTTAAPFGSFDTPINGSTGVQGAIGLTGWALDDVGVSKVEIWRSRVSVDPPPAPNGLIYVGDATIVSGARPDVAAIYSSFPRPYHAAWGYALLTNLLPNIGAGTPAGGVGTFTLYAYIYDVEGKLTILPTRTFSCDNAVGATKPFGTIDTPMQGQTVSGTIDNFGWALTPLSGTIPFDGSTVTLYIDGFPYGAATGFPYGTATGQYNFPRSDLAGYFPGLNNSAGPVGRFIIDTTKLPNGVHTIAWSVTDNLGRAEGLGSRYFMVLN